MNTTFMPSVNHGVGIVGGGAAGLYAAAHLLDAGIPVTVYEHKAKTLSKLLITGKGRCNVTNDCTEEEFLRSVLRNPRFLNSAVRRHPASAVMSFFENAGVPLKVERGGRVFPESDSSRDIAAALREKTRAARLIYEKVTSLALDSDRLVGVVTASGTHLHDAVLLATGGCSYPLTGSDGSGYKLAAQVDHTLVPVSPSLVPLTSDDPVCAAMQGLAPKNVSLTVVERATGRVLYRDFGEMLFTHFGISGPMVLSASAHLVGTDISALDAVIDWKSALDEKTLDARILSDFETRKNLDFGNALSALLPRLAIAPVIEKSGIDPHKKVSFITKEERKRLLRALKAFRVPLSGTRPIAEAIVTAGGIDVREDNPSTMMSRKKDGLFFAGEILDVDAYTGGFNLQIAFSSAAAAAEGIVRYLGA